MQELEKMLEEIEKYKKAAYENKNFDEQTAFRICQDIIRKHMKSGKDTDVSTNDGWIPVDEPPKKDYVAVFAVDKHDYYFVAVYDKEHGYRTNDVGADVDNIVSYCLFNPCRTERSE